MKIWCLKCLSVRIRQMNKVHLMRYRILLFALLLAFWVCSSIRNKAELSLIEKITFITAIADKKIIGVFCMSGVIVLRSGSRTAATSKIEHFVIIDLTVTKQKSNIRTLRKKLGKHLKQNYNAAFSHL